MSGRWSDHDLIAAMYAGHPGPRTYRVSVAGRLGESATYYVTALTIRDARAIAREYAARIDTDTFRFTTYPRVTDAERITDTEGATR